MPPAAAATFVVPQLLTTVTFQRSGAPIVVMCGDSITDNANPAGVSWYGVTGGYADQVHAQCPGATFINSGHAGDGTRTIADNVNTRILAFNLDILFLEIGINQWRREDYAAILGPVRGRFPKAQIACLSILWHNELWSHGPPVVFNNGATDSTLYPSNVDIRELCIQYGCVWMDMRAQGALYEQAHNTPEPGVATGILTSDGIHPNSNPGQLQMGGWAMAQTAFV